MCQFSLLDKQPYDSTRRSIMDVIDLGCELLRAPAIASFMLVARFYGYAWFGAIVGLLLLSYGILSENHRTRQAGMAVIASLAITEFGTEVIKRLASFTAADLNGWFYPSAHTSNAFGLSSVLALTFPTVTSLFYLLAVFTGLSRLYLRAPSIWSVVAGVVVGCAAGILSGRKVLSRGDFLGVGPFQFGAWFGIITLAIVGLLFFHRLDANSQTHLVSSAANASETTMAVRVDFGSAEARKLLRYGWSGDESWFNGKRTVVWATGLGAEFMISLPSEQGYRFRFLMKPYTPKGLACQRVEIHVNDANVAKISLKRGWNWYEVSVPKTATRAEKNTVQLFFNHADSPKSLKRGPDERPLSIAFDKLEIFRSE